MDDANKNELRQTIIDIMEQRSMNRADLVRELGFSFSTIKRILDPESDSPWARKTMFRIKNFISKYGEEE